MAANRTAKADILLLNAKDFFFAEIHYSFWGLTLRVCEILHFIKVFKGV